jgi:hypothetical protein
MERGLSALKTATESAVIINWVIRNLWVYPDFPNNLVHGKALVKTIESLKTG